MMVKKLHAIGLTLLLGISISHAAPIVVTPGSSAGYLYVPHVIMQGGGGGGGGDSGPVTGIGGVQLFKFTNQNDWTVEVRGQTCAADCNMSSFNTGAGFVNLKASHPVDWTDSSNNILANGNCRQARECQIWIDPNTSMEVRAHRYEVTINKSFGADTFTSVSSSFGGQTESCGAGVASCKMYRGVESKTYNLNGSAACRNVDGAEQTGSGTISCTSAENAIYLSLNTFTVNKVYGQSGDAYEVHFGDQVCTASELSCTFYGWGNNKTLSTPHTGGLSWNFGGGAWSALSNTSPQFNVVDGATYEVSSGFQFTVRRLWASDRNYTISYGGQNCPAGSQDCIFFAIGGGVTLNASKGVSWKLNSGAWQQYGMTSPSYTISTPGTVIYTAPPHPCSKERKNCTTRGEPYYEMDNYNGEQHTGVYIGSNRVVFRTHVMNPSPGYPWLSATYACPSLQSSWGPGWYLPDINVMHDVMLTYQTPGNAMVNSSTPIASGTYWTSTELDSTYAGSYSTAGSYNFNLTAAKTNRYGVMCVKNL